jgi:hypothetical protein
LRGCKTVSIDTGNTARNTMENVMKSISKILTAAAISFAVLVPTAGTSHAFPKGMYCLGKANNLAQKKIQKESAKNALIGGVMGAAFGSAVGGKKEAIAWGMGGAAMGAAATQAKYDKYVKKYYDICMAQP